MLMSMVMHQTKTSVENIDEDECTQGTYASKARVCKCVYSTTAATLQLHPRSFDTGTTSANSDSVQRHT